MDKVVIVVAAAELHDDEYAAMSIAVALASYIGSGVIVGGFAGRRAARIDAGILLAVHVTIQAVVMGICATLLLNEQLNLVLFACLLAVAGSLSNISRGAYQSILRASTSSHKYTATLSASSAISQGAYLVGPALGGFVCYILGSGVALLLVAPFYLGLLGPAMRSRQQTSGGQGGVSDALEVVTLSAASQHQSAKLILFSTGVFFFAYAVFVVQLPLLIGMIGNASEWEALLLGLSWTALGLGAALATVVFGIAVSTPKVMWLFYIIGLWGLCLIGLSLAGSVAFILVIMAIGGIAYAPYGVIATYALRVESGTDQRFRTLTTKYAAVAAASQPMGMILSGAMGASVTPNVVCAGAGAVLLVSAIASLIYLRSCKSRRTPLESG